MGLFRDLWRQKGSLQVVRATCRYHLACHGGATSMQSHLSSHHPDKYGWRLFGIRSLEEATIRIAKTTIRFSTSSKFQ